MMVVDDVLVADILYHDRCSPE